MSNKLNSSFKVCVTCERWGGPRNISTLRNNVEYDDNSDVGECIGGGFNRLKMAVKGSCGKWKKWGVLQ